jgi:hypothetical protein
VTQDDIERSIVRIRELAEYVVREFGPLSGIDFGYDRESVRWMEGFIERDRERADPARGVPRGLVNTIGAFLGECVVRETGGSWAWDEAREDWSVVFPRGGGAFPFVKVWKQFENGLDGGDSILSFYEVAVHYVAPGKLDEKRGGA